MYLYTLGCIILLLGSFGIVLCIRDYNIEFERVEGITGDEVTLVENIVRITRKGKEYLVNGNLTYHEDLGEDVMHSVTTTYSSDGSSLFRSHPYTVQKSSICEFFKKFYRPYGQPWIQGHSDFPDIPEEGRCPLTKGSWYIRDMSILNGTNLLPLHVPRGLWKVEQTIEKNGKIVGGLRMYAKVTERLF